MQNRNGERYHNDFAPLLCVGFLSLIGFSIFRLFFVYIFGLQWVFDLTRANGSCNEDWDNIFSYIPWVCSYPMGHRINFLNFWAVPFNYLALILGTIIGCVLVMPIIIVFFPCFGIYYGIKKLSRVENIPKEFANQFIYVLGTNIVYIAIISGYDLLLKTLLYRAWLHNSYGLAKILFKFLQLNSVLTIITALMTLLAIIAIAVMFFAQFKAHLELMRELKFDGLSWFDKFLKSLADRDGRLLKADIDLLFFIGITVLPFLAITSGTVLLIAVASVPTLLLVHYLIPHFITVCPGLRETKRDFQLIISPSIPEQVPLPSRDNPSRSAPAPATKPIPTMTVQQDGVDPCPSPVCSLPPMISLDVNAAMPLPILKSGRTFTYAHLHLPANALDAICDYLLLKEQVHFSAVCRNFYCQMQGNARYAGFWDRKYPQIADEHQVGIYFDYHHIANSSPYYDRIQIVIRGYAKFVADNFLGKVSKYRHPIARNIKYRLCNSWAHDLQEPKAKRVEKADIVVLFLTSLSDVNRARQQMQKWYRNRPSVKIIYAYFRCQGEGIRVINYNGNSIVPYQICGYNTDLTILLNTIERIAINKILYGDCIKNVITPATRELEHIMTMMKTPPAIQTVDTLLVTNADLRAGDILLKYHDGSLINKGIVIGTKVNARVYREGDVNKYITHAAICLEDGKIIVEAAGEGLQIRDVTSDDHYVWEIFRYTAHPEVVRLAIGFARVLTERAVGDRQSAVAQPSGQYTRWRACLAAIYPNPEHFPSDRHTEIAAIAERMDGLESLEDFALATEQYYCSHFVSFVYALAGQIIHGNSAEPPVDKDYRVILPAHLYKHLCENPSWQNVGLLDNTTRVMLHMQRPKRFPGSFLASDTEAHLVMDRVIVRIWGSAANPRVAVPAHAKMPTKDSVGHISIEYGIDRKYLSIWPIEEGLGIVKTCACKFAPDYNHDVMAEGRPADITYCFYTLDSSDMDDAFNNLKQKLKGWSLVGGLLCSNVESCASAAYGILCAGGLGNLTGTKRQRARATTDACCWASWHKGAHSVQSGGNLLTSRLQEARTEFAGSIAASIYMAEMGAGLIVCSPDQLESELQEAKKQELRNNPITRNIYFPRYNIHLMTFGAGQEPEIIAYYRMHPPRYDIIVLIQCGENYYVWPCNSLLQEEPQLIPIDINLCQELRDKFPAIGSNTCWRLDDGFIARGGISHRAWKEIMDKGNYTFTETEITAGRTCGIQ